MWPRLSTWRRPASRSSAPTIRSFVRSAVEDHLVERGGVELLDRAHALPQRAAGDQRRLDHLDEPGGELGRRQRRQQRGIAEHRRRQVVGADVVLGRRQVDAGLAAVGRIDLGDQRRRHLDDGDAALVGGGAEPGQVPDHAAAEGDDVVRPGHARLRELAEHPLCRGERLRRLARFDRDRGGKRLDRAAVEASDLGVGDQEAAPVHGPEPAREQAATEEDRIAPGFALCPGEPGARRQLAERSERRQRPRGDVVALWQDDVGERLVVGATLGEQRLEAARGRRPAAACPRPAPRRSPDRPRARRRDGGRAPRGRSRRARCRPRARSPRRRCARAARSRRRPRGAGTPPRRGWRRTRRSASRARARAARRCRAPRARPLGRRARRATCPPP